MRVSIVCNPNAGKRAAGGSLRGVMEVLEQAGWSIDVNVTAGPGDATRIAREAVANGMDAVLAAGGDGTINEVIQSLVGTDTALGYLPFGTVNIWARELAMPLVPERAAEAISTGRIETVDLGRANERYFLLMAGLGFDGEVVRRAHQFERYKSRLGILPYVAAGVSTATLYRGADLELRYDGIIRRVQALMLVVGNTRLYGGRFHLTPRAVANDGLLDLCIVKGKGPLDLARQSLPLLLSGSVTYSDVETLRIRDVVIRADEAVPYQLDGELCGETPVQFRVVPRALRVIVPEAFASDLIA
jgi:YegS/Rv2252/BmrU family lipid kinase